jgi:hypothetical protein
MYIIVLAIWPVGLALESLRVHRHLAKLERDCPKPTETMELLLHLAFMLPIAGTVPLLFVR